MKLKATVILERIFEVDPENHVEGSSKEEMIKAEKEILEESPLSEFSWDSEKIDIVEID